MWQCHHCSHTGGRHQTIKELYPKSSSAPSTVPRKVGSSRQKKPFSGLHWEIMVQLCAIGMRVEAYVINENLMSVCLLPPHALFFYISYVHCLILCAYKTSACFSIEDHLFAFLLMLLQYLKSYKTRWVIL